MAGSHRSTSQPVMDSTAVGKDEDISAERSSAPAAEQDPESGGVASAENIEAIEADVYDGEAPEDDFQAITPQTSAEPGDIWAASPRTSNPTPTYGSPSNRRVTGEGTQGVVLTKEILDALNTGGDEIEKLSATEILRSALSGPKPLDA